MTSNQIRYWEHKETQRHNVSTEKETNRHNVTTENETNRHNVATEFETNRHNVATEGIDLGRLNESIRHNQTTESETNRHNLNTESQGMIDLSIKQQQADEARRHNVASEYTQSLGTLSQIQTNTATQAEKEANANLSTYKAQFQQLENEWYELKNDASLNLSQADIDKIEAQIREIDERITYLPQQNLRDWVDTITGGLTNLAKLIKGVKN